MRKYTTQPSHHPRSYRVRQYTETGIGLFLSSIHINNVSSIVTQCPTLKESVEAFNREVLYYANKFIPIRVKIMKNSSKPYITEETKHKIKIKSAAWERYKTSRKKQDYDDYKKLTKEVQGLVAKNRTKWMMMMNM